MSIKEGDQVDVKTTCLKQALHIAKHLEEGLPDTLHVGLTGGVLYKEGERKDIDFVVYSHKCFNQIDTNDLAEKLRTLGFTYVTNYGRVIKSVFTTENKEIDVDIIVPESKSGEYVDPHVRPC